MIPPRALSRLAFAFLLLSFAPAEGQAAISREKRAAEISKLLKPIPDTLWQQIAGPRQQEQYTVAGGDTLWGISQRLFGDPRYWPKIWALNNGTITNPHLIVPGKRIAFMGGSGTTLPGVSLGSSSPQTLAQSSSNPANIRRHSGPIVDANGRSAEWNLLPRQRWENVSLKVPSEVDPTGFDSRSRVSFPSRRGLDPELIVQSEEIDFAGDISGAKTPGTFLGYGDLVYIEEDSGVEIGRTYALTSRGKKFEGRETGNQGWVYPVLGRVKILSKTGDRFLGEIGQSRSVITRGNRLMPVPERIKDLRAIPGPSNLTAAIVVERSVSAAVTSQHKFVYIDRGTDDGIQPGMVFRYFNKEDAQTGKEMTEDDLIPEADFMVVQVSTGVSVALVIRSTNTVADGETVTLLTDVSDLNRARVVREKDVDATPTNDLDALSGSDALGEDEKKELEQLEKWRENPKTGDEVPPPEDEIGEADTAPIPEEDAVPPPEDSEEQPVPEDSPPPEEDAPPPESEDAPPPEAEKAPPPEAEEAEAPPPAEEETLSPDDLAPPSE